jgi:hypothetical protein
MTDRSARFVVIEDSFDGSDPLVIKDIGRGSRQMSVTNDAEGVVERLLRDGRLQPGQRLFYYDSEGGLDEMLVKDGKFAGFAPGPRP